MLFTWNHSDDRKERNGKRQKTIVRKKEQSRGIWRWEPFRNHWQKDNSYETMLDNICSFHWWYLENNNLKTVGQTDFFFSVRMPTKIKKRNNFSYLSVIKLFSVFVFLCPLEPLPLVRSQPASGEWNDSPCFSIIPHQFTGIVQWPAGLWAGQDGFEPGLTVCSGVRGTDTRKTSICHTFRQKN